MLIVDVVYKQDLVIVDKYLNEHRNFLQKYYDKNMLIASGPKDPRTGGIILANIDKNNILKIINRFESSSFKSILILAGLLDSDLTKVSNSLKTSYIDHIKQKEEWMSLVIKNK